MMDQRPARMAAIRRALTEQHVDALLVSALPNMRYLTGFSGSAGMLVVTMTDAVFITDFRYQTQVADEVACARVIIEPQSLWARLWAVLPELSGVERIGFESAHLL